MFAMVFDILKISKNGPQSNTSTTVTCCPPSLAVQTLLVLLQEFTLLIKHTLHIVLHEAGRCLGIYDPTAQGPYKLLELTWELWGCSGHLQ